MKAAVVLLTKITVLSGKKIKSLFYIYRKIPCTHPFHTKCPHPKFEISEKICTVHIRICKIDDLARAHPLCFRDYLQILMGRLLDSSRYTEKLIFLERRKHVVCVLDASCSLHIRGLTSTEYYCRKNVKDVSRASSEKATWQIEGSVMCYHAPRTSQHVLLLSWKNVVAQP